LCQQKNFSSKDCRSVSSDGPEGIWRDVSPGESPDKHLIAIGITITGELSETSTISLMRTIASKY
jgi:hypothetical protein